mmetsp:Transcript_24169/g.24775  ORF Transcript_24169/g.24775 Transcript_24169/m.24775 type:complete len:168 (+) Transcript_24169:62-565(+)
MSSQSLLQLALSSKGIRWISFGWIGFILENLILSENRTKIIEAFGDDNYHMTYSTLSTLACGSIFYGYIIHGRKKGPLISSPTLIRKISSFILQTLGLVGASQTIPLIRMPYTYVNESNPSIENNNNSTPTTTTSTTISATSTTTTTTATVSTTRITIWLCFTNDSC